MMHARSYVAQLAAGASALALTLAAHPAFAASPALGTDLTRLAPGMIGQFGTSGDCTFTQLGSGILKCATVNGQPVLPLSGGTLSGGFTVGVNNPGGNGQFTLSPGSQASSANYAGYLSFFLPLPSSASAGTAPTRSGYIGFGDGLGNNQIAAENGAGWHMTGKTFLVDPPTTFGAPATMAPVVTGAPARTDTARELDVLKVADFGADSTGNVDMCASGGVWSKITTAAQNTTLYPNGVQILFGSGSFKASCQLVLPLNMNAQVFGIGHGTSINFTGTSAGFSATENAIPYRVEVANMALTTATNTTTPAVSISYPPANGQNIGTGSQQGPSVHDLWIYGVGNSYAWAQGVNISGPFNVAIRDVLVVGNSGSSKTSSSGIDTTNTYACFVLGGQAPSAVMVHNLCYYAQIGLSIAGDSEGMKAFANEFVQVNVGFQLDGTTAPNAPLVQLLGNHVNSYYYGVKLLGWNQAIITGNSFFKINTATTPYAAVGLKNITTKGAGYQPDGTVVGSGQNIVSGNFAIGYASGRSGGGAVLAELDAPQSYTNASNQSGTAQPYANMIDGNYAENMTYVLNALGNTAPFTFRNNYATDTVSSGGWIANPPTNMLSSGNMPEDAGAEPSYVNVASGATTINLGSTIHRVFHISNSSATTITSITGGSGGETIMLVPQDNNTTVQYNANLLTCPLANEALTNNKAKTFRRDGPTTWRESACQ